MFCRDARAIINNPKLLIADEPTGNLDPETAWDIMDILEGINESGTTIVMVTHSKNIVDQMEKLLEMMLVYMDMMSPVKLVR